MVRLRSSRHSISATDRRRSAPAAHRTAGGPAHANDPLVVDVVPERRARSFPRAVADSDGNVYKDIIASNVEPTDLVKVNAGSHTTIAFPDGYAVPGFGLAVDSAGDVFGTIEGGQFGNVIFE